MFNLVYEFFYDWLWSGGIPLGLPENFVFLATVLITVAVVLFVLWLAILPLKALLRAIFN